MPIGCERCLSTPKESAFLTDWGQRASGLLGELAAISEPGPGVTRMPFSQEHRAAVDLLTLRMVAAGLKVWLDDAGTLIGRFGANPGARTLLMGSHQDSVREGGAFDGIMGVVLPLLSLERLREDGITLPFAVEILAFADEEGVRFPTALIGSRALAGTYDPAVLELADADGVTLRSAMTGFGLTPDNIPSLRRNPDAVIGFVETHIEQGPVLEREGEALGVVTAISGIERHQITVTGETGHAGTLPMAGRRDALVGAAALVTEVNRLGRVTPDLRATVGALAVEPNVVNAVPRRVRATAEFRSPCDATRSDAGKAMQRFAASIAEETGLEISCVKTYAQDAQPCDPELSAGLVQSMKHLGARVTRLPSGATHDASALANLCPVAMLFVRCRDGVSHRPEEFATSGDLGKAVDVLADFLRALAIRYNR